MVAALATASRKVRTPQGAPPGNTRGRDPLRGRTYRIGPQKHTALFPSPFPRQGEGWEEEEGKGETEV